MAAFAEQVNSSGVQPNNAVCDLTSGTLLAICFFGSISAVLIGVPLACHLGLHHIVPQGYVGVYQAHSRLGMTEPVDCRASKYIRVLMCSKGLRLFIRCW